MKSLRTCLIAGLLLQLQVPDNHGVMLHVQDPIINTTVSQDIVLAIECLCNGTTFIKWEHMSSRGIQHIIEWKSGSYRNISENYNDRVQNYENGSIKLLNVGVKDTGFYVVTVTEEFGLTKHGTIVLNVHEILYEDFYFVAVFIAFLAAGAAVLVLVLWICNKCANIYHKKKQLQRAEEMEMRIIAEQLSS
ncbi:V-set and transmembrane domain-containing protein 5 [Xenopus laevis]|uniref:V-set and transmembrane domain-containing protein 5 n=1 Tax=Xenopus laevis TaxID=8355 RepID=A0A8J0U973_XENLA|nr:V-set and transmembrane domain-containing protein 5 [Xenopus laevis]